MILILGTYFKFKVVFETFPVRHIGAECEASVKDDDDDATNDSIASSVFLNKKKIL